MDGGLNIPHAEKRFVGYDTDSKELNAEVLKGHIFGEHVSEYMSNLQDEDPDKYQKQFSRYIEAGIEPESLEEMYRNAHERIRADPTPKKAAKKQAPAGGWPSYRDVKMTREAKREALQKRISELMEVEDD